MKILHTTKQSQNLQKLHPFKISTYTVFTYMCLIHRDIAHVFLNEKGHVPKFQLNVSRCMHVYSNILMQ